MDPSDHFIYKYFIQEIINFHDRICLAFTSHSKIQIVSCIYYANLQENYLPVIKLTITIANTALRTESYLAVPKNCKLEPIR